MDWMPQAIREGIFTILFISGPLVILAAALGLAVGILQAATQVQEQTLGSAVKVIGLFIALIIFGFYMFQYVSKYTTDSINKAFKLVPTLTAKVLPRRNFLEVPIKEPEKQLTLPSADEASSGGGSGAASHVAESLNEPEVENINQNTKPTRMSQPASQVKPFPDVDKIKAQKLPAQTQGSSKVNAQRSTAPTTTQTKTTTPVKPVAVKPVPVPTPAPAAIKPAPVKPIPTKQATPQKPVVKAVQPSALSVEPTPVPEEPKAPVIRAPRPALTGRLDKLKEEAVR